MHTARVKKGIRRDGCYQANRDQNRRIVSKLLMKTVSNWHRYLGKRNRSRGAECSLDSKKCAASAPHHTLEQYILDLLGLEASLENAMILLECAGDSHIRYLTDTNSEVSIPPLTATDFTKP